MTFFMTLTTVGTLCKMILALPYFPDFVKRWYVYAEKSDVLFPFACHAYEHGGAAGIGFRGQ